MSQAVLTWTDVGSDESEAKIDDLRCLKRQRVYNDCATQWALDEVERLMLVCS